MKKLLIFIAMLVLATTLFAENEKVSCESEFGKCSFELSGETLSQNCVCSNGREFSGSDPVFEGYTMVTEEGCLSEIDNWCKKIPANCSNDAGACKVNENGKYECYCHYVDGKKTGSGYFGEEGCNEILVEMCGTETPTPRKVCAEEILNECVSYFERIKNTCSEEPINDINEILDAPIDYSTESSITVHEFADCCRNEYWRNEYKRESDCIETFDSCENKECCECTIQVGGEVDDTANTEAPTTGATPEDTTDGDSAPATDSESSAEKEESKSDGCSMLFI
ncbi:hypothetical protein IKO70_06135 [bacterium]|nr:hypothetical protein [bacterium]